MRKHWAGLLGIAAVGLGVLLPTLRSRTGDATMGAAVQAAPVSASDDTCRRVWTVTVPGFRSAALSPDGRYIGIVFNYSPRGGQEKVGLWRWASHPDAPLWVRREPDMSQIIVGMGGEAVLTWAPLDPTKKTVSLRRGTDGVQLLAQTVDGAVWDAKIAPDGQLAALSTGARSLYLLTLGDHPKPRRWTLDGLASSLTFAPGGDTLTASTWDTSGISLYTTNGMRLWQYPNDASSHPTAIERSFEAQATGDGKSVLGLSYTTVRHGDAGVYLWHTSGDGAPRWQYALGPDAYRPQAAVSADGRFVAVGYVRTITRGEQSVSERRLAFFDTHADKPLWQQGNLLFSPQLVGMAPHGERITVTDGQRSLYNLNAQGRVTSGYTLRDGGVIRQISVTPDDHFALVYTSSGQLSLIQIGSGTS